jgi:hypothetical protein
MCFAHTHASLLSPSHTEKRKTNVQKRKERTCASLKKTLAKLKIRKPKVACFFVKES